MKRFNFYIAFLFLILPFSLFALAPYPKVNEKQNTIKVKEFIDAPINEIEQKLGEKLKWHEKIAIKSFKRKLKRQAKKHPNVLETHLSLKEQKPLLHQLLMGLLGLLIIFVIGILILAIACGNDCFGP